MQFDTSTSNLIAVLAFLAVASVIALSASFLGGMIDLTSSPEPSLIDLTSPSLQSTSGSSDDEELGLGGGLPVQPPQKRQCLSKDNEEDLANDEEEEDSDDGETEFDFAKAEREDAERHERLEAAPSSQAASTRVNTVPRTTRNSLAAESDTARSAQGTSTRVKSAPGTTRSSRGIAGSAQGTSTQVKSARSSRGIGAVGAAPPQVESARSSRGIGAVGAAPPPGNHPDVEENVASAHASADNVAYPPGTEEAGKPNIPNGYKEVPTSVFNFGGKTIPPNYKFYIPEDKEDAEKSIQLCSDMIRKACIMLLMVNVVVQGVSFTWIMVHNTLMTLFNAGELLVNYFSRGAGSSGRNWHRTREVIMESEFFRTFVEPFRKHFHIGRGFVVGNESGEHPKHGDKIARKCRWRAILSLLCAKKIMWFEDVRTGARFGILVPHGALVLLSHTGSGFIGPVRHFITDGDNSWIFAMDIGLLEKA